MARAKAGLGSGMNGLLEVASSNHQLSLHASGKDNAAEDPKEIARKQGTVFFFCAFGTFFP